MLTQKSVIGAIRTPVINGKLVLGGKFPTAIREWMNNEFGTVHTIMIAGKPWFMGTEIANILGYVNPRDAVHFHVKDSCKQTINLNTIEKIDGIQNSINPNRVIINEIGFYSLVFHSHMPKAQEFAHWVYEEVLPSIRKYGAYVTPETLSDIKDNPAAQQDLIHQLENEIATLKPLAKYTQDVLKSDEALPITLIAKEYGMTAQAFNKLLNKKGILFRYGKRWYPYKEYENLDWFTYQTHLYTDTSDHKHTSTHLYVTQTGRKGLRQLMLNEGIKSLVG